MANTHDLANDIRKHLQWRNQVEGCDWDGLGGYRHCDHFQFDAPEGQLEQLMGKQSTLLPVGFLELGLQRSRSVARVVTAGGESGTGFLVGKNLLITNNHVLLDKETAAGPRSNSTMSNPRRVSTSPSIATNSARIRGS